MRHSVRVHHLHGAVGGVTSDMQSNIRAAPVRGHVHAGGKGRPACLQPTSNHGDLTGRTCTQSGEYQCTLNHSGASPAHKMPSVDAGRTFEWVAMVLVVNCRQQPVPSRPFAPHLRSELRVQGEASEWSTRKHLPADTAYGQ